MAKIQFYLDSGANIHSQKKSTVLDTVDDLCMEEGEWEDMTEDAKYEMADEWAQQQLCSGYIEL